MLVVLEIYMSYMTELSMLFILVLTSFNKLSIPLGSIKLTNGKLSLHCCIVVGTGDAHGRERENVCQSGMVQWVHIGDFYSSCLQNFSKNVIMSSVNITELNINIIVDTII